MKLNGVLRLRCAWFESGHVQLTVCPQSESLDSYLARFLFGAKPGAAAGYEAEERLFSWDLEAVPIQEGLAAPEQVPGCWCQGCQALPLGKCAGEAADRRRCLELCRADEQREEAGP